MILKIRVWCEELIIAIILCIIIECLIPNGNNKKYAKVVIGVFIMFITINPLLEILNYEYDFDEVFDMRYEETYSSLDYDIKDVYIIGIKEEIKKEIMNLGYKVNDIKFEFDYGYEKISKIKIEFLENEIDYQKVLDMLKERYLVEKNNVIITFK